MVSTNEMISKDKCECLTKETIMLYVQTTPSNGQIRITWPPFLCSFFISFFITFKVFLLVLCFVFIHIKYASLLFFQ